ncbi:DUF3757 domain-containing protein [Pseudomonas sp. SAICEU22]|uniref:DUF3757 domain-containing protein n=1 Tax=Pseudomonas agronomica TaxID=2979328 RepID=A0ABT3FC81_9PSED|nr:DUF3757 domain-containing protein [Pseudomonas agronomica]MCW1246657.1 DUF3757 domain-containing protein [Pseudomonas agronomica]
MLKILWTGSTALLSLIIGQVHAGEITCPAAADIHRNIEAVEDIYFVGEHSEFEWQSQSLVDAVDPQSLSFKGADYALHVEDNDEGLPTHTTITCRYGEINLILEYSSVQEPAYSAWLDNTCNNQDVKQCQLITSDYFQVNFD